MPPKSAWSNSQSAPKRWGSHSLVGGRSRNRSLRQVKELGEIAQMRKAALLAGDVLCAALKLLKPGVREIEIAAEIEYLMRSRGASVRPSELSWRLERAPHIRMRGQRKNG